VKERDRERERGNVSSSNFFESRVAWLGKTSYASKASGGHQQNSSATWGIGIIPDVCFQRNIFVSI
jgi:hypothetical protein